MSIWCTEYTVDLSFIKTIPVYMYTKNDGYLVSINWRWMSIDLSMRINALPGLNRQLQHNWGTLFLQRSWKDSQQSCLPQHAVLSHEIKDCRLCEGCSQQQGDIGRFLKILSVQNPLRHTAEDIRSWLYRNSRRSLSHGCRKCCWWLIRWGCFGCGGSLPFLSPLPGGPWRFC